MARQDHIAEFDLPHLGLPIDDSGARIGNGSGAEKVEKFRQKICENVRQIGPTIFGEIPGYLLQSDDIGPLDGIRYALRIILAVRSEAVLDVKAHEFHVIL